MSYPITEKKEVVDNYFEIAYHSTPPIHSSSIVINKFLLEKINGFPTNIEEGEDLITWATLANQYDFVFINIPLSEFIFILGDIKFNGYFNRVIFNSGKLHS